MPSTPGAPCPLESLVWPGDTASDPVDPGEVAANLVEGSGDSAFATSAETLKLIASDAKATHTIQTRFICIDTSSISIMTSQHAAAVSGQ